MPKVQPVLAPERLRLSHNVDLNDYFNSEEKIEGEIYRSLGRQKEREREPMFHLTLLKYIYELWKQWIYLRDVFMHKFKCWINS